MKKLVLLAALVAVPGLSAAETAQRYLVATRHVAHGVVTKDPADTPRGENVQTFENVDGYAADLTPSDVAALRNNPAVRYVEPVKERHAFAVDGSDVRDLTKQTTPYGVDYVGAPQVWPTVTGTGINVVVIDTGIDFRHAELKGVYAGGLNTYGASDPLDDAGHGTHCAGTIAAANNSEGVVGVAPGIRLWAVKVLNSQGSGSTDRVVRGIDWAINKKKTLGGNWVLSLSLGSDESSTFEEEAFARAIDAGLLVVAASGNESTAGKPAPVAYPAAYPGVVSVGATDSNNAIASFSNQGPSLTVVAPGVNVLSTLPIGSASLGFIEAAGGTVNATPITGSGRGTITGTYVNCGLGRPQDFPASVAGKIALIKRGDLTFGEKAKNAVNAGASAVIIYNKDASALNFTLIAQDCDASGANCVDNPGDLAYKWPVVLAVTQKDGEALAAATNPAPVTVASIADDYGTKSGTSMATPHVAGVAALVWSADPNAPASAVVDAIQRTARDLGDAGRDSAFGFGIVDALAAAKTLAPQRFGTGATPPPPVTPQPSTGRQVLKRGGGH